MKIIKSFTLVWIELSISLITFAQSNSYHLDWKIQNLQLSTRWSKDVTPDNALSQYPRPQMVRSEWENLNGLWEYAITDSSQQYASKYDGRILVPFPIESALSGIKKRLLPTQKLWYRRNIELAKQSLDKRYLLHFGAVDFSAVVFINKKQVRIHKGGYEEFTIDITSQLHKGTNELLVSVLDPTNNGDNPHGKQVLRPEGIMYTASTGIWQTVWLEVVPKEYIESLVITPIVDSSYVIIRVNSNANRQVVVSSNDGKMEGSTNKNLRLYLHNPHLWSPSDPYLYDVTIALKNNGQKIDEVKSYFGMRKIAVQKDSNGIDRIFLNNQYTFNLGVLDQGFWPDGLYTAPTDEALKFDIETIKNMGFNTIRKHIKIEPSRWYYYCDKLGLLVWQDMVTPANLTAEAKKEFENENKQTVAQLYNHPSIICWVLFNEGWNRYDQQRLTEEMKKIDPTRIINGHSGENYDRDAPKDDNRKWVESDVTDIHDYPGPGIPPIIKGKARVLGEWGGVRVGTPGHQWDPTKGWGYVQTNGNDFKTKYLFMIKHLKVYEEEGLSGAIYTQPFDVEIEENGLITYDREIFKIPITEIQHINQLILK